MVELERGYNMDNQFWKNKKVLVTGHTGFKGSWLTICLIELGAIVVGYSLDPTTEKDNFVLCNLSDKIIDIRGDIKDNEKLYNVFQEYQPEIVFHLAAQPLVRLSYSEPVNTYETNVMGTLNVLECIRKTKSTHVGIMITTDKCYENHEQIWGYRENDRLGGFDPYSSSKACAEILIDSYRNSYFNLEHISSHQKAIASVRAGNVIGGGDWSQDRIVPDCIRALEERKTIGIRNPKAIRPWQHVLEPLSGYIILAEKLYQNPNEYSGGWNFGPNYVSFNNVWDICNLIINEYGNGELEDMSNPDDMHEANLLFLDITKARNYLNWNPKIDIITSIKYTIEWYKKYTEENMYELCVEQFNRYIKL